MVGGLGKLPLKECGYDVRKALNQLQYGKSDPIPKYVVPSANLTIEKMYILRQEMFGLPDPLHEYRVYKQGISQNAQTKY
jgi:hypothetical protein